MQQPSKTEGAGYVSDMLGKITAEQFDLADKPLTTEWEEIFAGTRIFAAILYIEKTQPFRELTGQQIYDILRKAGFCEDASNEAMRLFSTNNLINTILERSGYEVESLVYPEDGISYLKRMRMVYEGTVEVLLSWARNDSIIICPIDTPLPPESSVFEYLDNGHGKAVAYWTINQMDVLPVSIADSDYDGALEKVHLRINRIVEKFFGGNLKIEDSKMSPGIITKITKDCPRERTYDFRIYDKFIDDFLYILKYAKGEIQSVFGGLPIEEIVNVLKEAGVWEK